MKSKARLALTNNEARTLERAAAIIAKHWGDDPIPFAKDHAQVAEYFRLLIGHKRVEEFHAVFVCAGLSPLNRGDTLIGRGSNTSTVVSIQDIIRRAIAAGAYGMIVAHNHPSARMMPSQADDNLTRRLIEACRIFDLAMLDHVIVGPCLSHYSYAEHGRI